jgi:hypothetical protein
VRVPGASELRWLIAAATAAAPARPARAGGARAALRLAEGEAEAALSDLRTAQRAWRQIEAPFEVAELGLQLARAHRALGDEDAARMEARAARDAFQRLGARPAAEVAAALLGELAPAAGQAERVGRTFMFTDIVKSTDLVGVIGDDAWEDLLRWHDATLRSLFARHEGEVAHHTGDGFFVAFPDPGSAIRAAVAASMASRIPGAGRLSEIPEQKTALTSGCHLCLTKYS